MADESGVRRTGAQLVGVVDLCGRLKAVLDAVECGAVHELSVNPAAQQGLKDAGWAAVTDAVAHADGTKPGTGRATVRLADQLVEHPAVAAAGGRCRGRGPRRCRWNAPWTAPNGPHTGACS